MTVDLRPMPDEIKEMVVGLRVHFPDVYPEDARKFATFMMLNDTRLPRISNEIVKLEAKVNILMSEVREWLCPGCNTVYPELPGPADNALTRFRCPNCNSDVGLMNAIRLRKEREDRRAERRNMEAQIALFSQLAEESGRAVTAIAQKEQIFLAQVAVEAHKYHEDRPVPWRDWKECRLEPCKMLQDALRPRETAEEQQRAKEAYERAVGRG